MIEVTGYKTEKKYFINPSMISSFSLEHDKGRKTDFTMIYLTQDTSGHQRFGACESPEEIMDMIFLSKVTDESRS